MLSNSFFSVALLFPSHNSVPPWYYQYRWFGEACQENESFCTFSSSLPITNQILSVKNKIIKSLIEYVVKTFHRADGSCNFFSREHCVLCGTNLFFSAQIWTSFMSIRKANLASLNYRPDFSSLIREFYLAQLKITKVLQTKPLDWYDKIVHIR